MGMIETSAVELLAIILSVVALIVTVLGFFASLGFYRHGVNLQKNAESVLAKIEEKVSSIQSQVGGMFDKTLDAAIANKQQVSTEFDAIQDKIAESENTISALSAGTEGQEKFNRVVEQEMKDLKKLVLSARESATTAITPSPSGSGLFQNVTIPPFASLPGVMFRKRLEDELKQRDIKITNLTIRGSKAFVNIDKPINDETRDLLLLIADKYGYSLQVNWSAIEG